MFNPASNTVFNHQFCQPDTINKYNTGTQLLSGLDSTLRKSRRGNENTFRYIFQPKSAVEVTYSPRTYFISFCVPLRLNIDLINAERILVDHSINTIITRPPKSLPESFEVP